MPEIPEATMPRDDATRDYLEEQLDAWWADLTGGQKMHVYGRIGED